MCFKWSEHRFCQFGELNNATTAELQANRFGGMEVFLGCGPPKPWDPHWTINVGARSFPTNTLWLAERPPVCSYWVMEYCRLEECSAQQNLRNSDVGEVSLELDSGARGSRFISR